MVLGQVLMHTVPGIGHDKGPELSPEDLDGCTRLTQSLYCPFTYSSMAATIGLRISRSVPRKLERYLSLWPKDISAGDLFGPESVSVKISVKEIVVETLAGEPGQTLDRKISFRDVFQERYLSLQKRTLDDTHHDTVFTILRYG